MQHRSRPVNEEFAQVSITVLRDADQLGFASCRDLPRHETEPCGQIAPFAKTAASADSGHERCRDCWTNAGDLHQALHIGIRLSQSLHLSIYGRDPLIDYVQL